MSLLLIGTIDYFAIGQLLEFSVFFLLPVSCFTWFVNWKAGFIASAASAAIIRGVNLASPTHAAVSRANLGVVPALTQAKERARGADLLAQVAAIKFNRVAQESFEQRDCGGSTRSQVR